MKTKLSVAILVGCLAAAGQASAQYCEIERTHLKSDGDGVSADFSSVDTTTCALGVETNVHVEASQGAVITQGVCGRGKSRVTNTTTTESTAVAVLVGVYDRCLGMQLLSVTGTGTPDDFHVSNSLNTASLRAAFQGTDGADQPVSIAVDLVWAGTGQKDRTGNHQSVNEGIFKFVSNSSGTIRDALSTGSVIVGGTEQTPNPSTQGTIEGNALHSLIVYR